MIVPGKVIVRPATAAHANAAALVLRRSIVELCAADHGDDPAAIAAWTANKTAGEWLAWLDRDDVALFVAVEDATVLGVGMVGNDGVVRLNYVSPDARFRGVSKALLAGMEAFARARGQSSCRLESSATAARFYAAAGYRADDLRGGRWMVKNL